MNAKVEISLADLDNLRTSRARAETELADLRKNYDALRTSLAAVPEDVRKNIPLDALGDGPNLVAALAESLTIVRFAIGNLDPMTVRGWPHRSLLALAELLPKVPGVSDEDRELWMDWRIFARRAGEWEDARARGLEQEKLAEENSAKVPGSRFGEIPGIILE